MASGFACPQQALRMVQQTGGRICNTFGVPPDFIRTLGIKTLEQLRLKGFEREPPGNGPPNTSIGAVTTAAGSSEDGMTIPAKIHVILVAEIFSKAETELLKQRAERSGGQSVGIARTGLRSCPVDNADSNSSDDSICDRWRQFRRTGTVIAEKRAEAWTWKSRSGQTMQAGAGDWAVEDAANGDRWSVRDDIFRSRYDHVEGQYWRRHGTVRARPARDGEIVDTLEGRVTASAGDWVVRGEHGDQWPVPGDEFAQRHEGPIGTSDQS